MRKWIPAQGRDDGVMHCCEMMRSNVENRCDVHESRTDCPDCLIDFWPENRTYGLMVHDGGGLVISIHFCPWCGTSLPESPNAAND